MLLMWHMAECRVPITPIAAILLLAIPLCSAVTGPLTGIGAFCAGKAGQKVAAGWCDSYIQCTIDGSSGTVYKCPEGQLFSLDSNDCSDADSVWCPDGKRGFWGPMMESGGVVSIHCALVPYTSRVLAWQRGQAWWDVKPEPGMAIPGSEQLNTQGRQWEYLSALQDPLANKYMAYQVDPPFCSGQSQLPDGRILVCGGDYGNMSGRMGEQQGIDVCRTFKCWEDDISKCVWENIPERLSVKRWYPTQLQFPGYDANGPFTLIMGGSAVGQDPGVWTDVYQHMDVFFPYSKTGQQMYQINATQFTTKIGNLNMYPFLFLLPAQHNGKHQMLQLASNYGEIVTVDNPIKVTGSNPIEVQRVLPALKDDQERDVAVTYPAGGCAVLHALEHPWTDKALITIFGGLPGTYSEFSDFSAVKADFSAVGNSWTIDAMNNASTWEREVMPDVALLRNCLLLPNGKVSLMHGVQSGKETASNNGAACTKGQQYHSWLFDINQPAGDRYLQDASVEPTWRGYHGCALVLPDGSAYSAGCETDPVPDDTNECVGPRNYHYNVDGYVPMDNYIAILDNARPTISKFPETFALGSTIQVTVQGRADECSLMAPGATTHLLNMAGRVAFMKTLSPKALDAVAADEEVLLELLVPADPLVFMHGPALLYCMWQRGAYSEGVWVTVELPTLAKAATPTTLLATLSG